MSPSLRLFFAIILLPALAHAGAWTQKRDKMETITGASYYRAHDYYNNAGRQLPQQRYDKLEITSYTEYGLRDYLTLGGRSGVAGVRQKAGGFTSRSIESSDTEAFARIRLWNDDLSVFSVQPTLYTPATSRDTNQTNTGGRKFSMGMKSSYGRNYRLLDKWHYADVSAEYVQRLGKESNQLKFEATTGLNIDRHWQVMPQLFVTRNLGGMKDPRTLRNPPNDYDLTKISLTGQYRFNRTNALQLSAFKHVDGKNTGAGSGIGINYVRSIGCVLRC